MIKRYFQVGISLLLPVVLSGCFVSNPDIQNPIERKIGWFSYLAGENLANTCHADTPTRLRVIHNAGYYDYVSVYNISFLSKGDSLLKSDRFGRVNFANLSISDPLRPGRGQQADVTLSLSETAKIRQIITQTDVFKSDFASVRAWSAQHYRVFMMCHQGKMSYYADKFPWEESATGQAAESLFDLLITLDPLKIDYPVAKDVIVDREGLPLEKSIYDESDAQFVATFDKDGYAWY